MDEKTEAHLLEEARRVQAEAETAVEGSAAFARCSVGGEVIFWLGAPRALLEGHVYSAAGRAEAKLSGCCEWHFDKIMQFPTDRNSPSYRALSWFVGEREHVLYQAFELTRDYDGTMYPRGEVTDLDEANLVSSELVRQRGTHTILLDLDVPARLIPSSTPGHTHLSIDVDVKWEKYLELLELLAEIGVLEPGYVGASKERQATNLRLPWITKDLFDTPDNGED
jgi:hypothetical protein